MRPSFNTRAGFWGGMAYVGTFYMVFRSREPWTMQHGKPDNEMIESKEKHLPIDYPKHDGNLTFDLLTSVALTGTNHEENQPSHVNIEC